MFNIYLAGALSACVVFNLISGRIRLFVVNFPTRHNNPLTFAGQCGMKGEVE